MPIPPFGGSGGEAGESSVAGNGGVAAASGSGGTAQGGSAGADSSAAGAREAGAGEAGAAGAAAECGAGFGDCNGRSADGCEAALNTAANCGSCGNDCGSAACAVGGFCNAVPLGSARYTYRQVVSGGSLFRLGVLAGSYNIEGSYTLIRTPLDGSAEVIMDAQSKSIGGLTADDSFVYWAVGGTASGVFKDPLGAAAGTTPTPVFAPVSLPFQLRIQGGAMYWPATDGNIYTRAMAATVTDPGTLIVSNFRGTGALNFHQDFVTTPTHLYWVVAPSGGSPNLGTLRTTPLAGGVPTDVASAIPAPWLKLAVSGEDLYFIQSSGSAFDGIWHFAAGGTAALLVSQAGVTAVAVDSGSLYYAVGDKKLFKVSVAGGTGTQIGASTATAVDLAAFDATHVYEVSSWTHGGGFPPPNTAFVLPK